MSKNETFKEKYPQNFLLHFLSMFNSEKSNDEFNKHVVLTFQIEGKEYLKSLICEINEIESNNDLNLILAELKNNKKLFNKKDIDIIKALVNQVLSSN